MNKKTRVTIRKYLIDLEICDVKEICTQLGIRIPSSHKNLKHELAGKASKKLKERGIGIPAINRMLLEVGRGQASRLLPLENKKKSLRETLKIDKDFKIPSTKQLVEEEIKTVKRYQGEYLSE